MYTLLIMDPVKSMGQLTAISSGHFNYKDTTTDLVMQSCSLQFCTLPPSSGHFIHKDTEHMLHDCTYVESTHVHT